MIVAFWHALRGFRQDSGLFLAAGLSFYFLVCLVPMLFLFVSLMGYLLTSEAATTAVLNQLAQLVPVYRKELSEMLARLIATRKTSGVIGTVILLFFSTQLFGCLRTIMNIVFEERKGRGILRGMLYDVLMLAVIGVLFITSMVITDLFFWFRSLVFAPAHMPRQWVRYTFLAIALGFNTALYFVVYRYFPTRRIHVGAAMAGAVLASLLWEIAKQIFRWYILSIGVYDQIYGALGFMVALTMFVYYSGIVLVLGAEYAAAVEARWRKGHTL
ncbi:MAG TPA: YihY/virulence factor BrkB family protein [Verrucomicrobiae bacterium]|nr:YihY/virulence factor BrkB family protein [Verrucomicrobiae bacterium]